MIYHVAAHRQAGVPKDADSIIIHFIATEESESITDGKLFDSDESIALCAMLAPLFDVKRQKRISPDSVVKIYNTYANKNGWQQCQKLPETLRRTLLRATKQFPEANQWHTIMKGWESDKFFSGKDAGYDYRPKIRTMLYRSRYEEFYENGMSLGDDSRPASKVDAIIDEFRSLLGN